MKHVRVLTATIFFCSLINTSCSQAGSSANTTNKTRFAATTPCNDEIRQMLGIPSGIECGMMKWDLSLYHDDKDFPLEFELSFTYGSPKQGTRGFKEGAKTIELKGKWMTKKIKIGGSDKEAVTLLPNNSSVTLTFLRASENLLHLLRKDGTPMVGGAAWSYTLNNTDPVENAPMTLASKQITSTGVVSPTDTFAVFVGRTPCNESLRKLNNITAEGCQIIKCRLILLQDRKTQAPSDFFIQTIYVGKGDKIYGVDGKWKLLQGLPADPNAIIYQLLTDSPQPGIEILLLKAGDNIVFFINRNSQLLVGDEYCSYTLNRTD